MSIVGAHPESQGIKRRLPLFALLATSAASSIGNFMTFVAVPWFVLQTTGSAAKTGLASGMIALATVTAGLFGGPIVDKFGFKRISIVSDLASGVTIALIPLLHQTVGLAFWQLIGLVFLGSFLDSPGVTARESLIPDLARLSQTPVERANAAYQAINRVSMLVGPALAGVLLAAFGASVVLWLDAVTFLLSALAISVFIPAAVLSAEGEVRDSEGSYLTELMKGLEFLWRDRPMLSIITIAVAANFLLDPLSSVVLPVYSQSVYGSAVNLGLMIAGFGGGALAGAACFGIVGHRISHRLTFVLAVSVVGLPLWLLTTIPDLPLAMASLILMGFAIGPINPLLFTVLQQRTPKRMLGRVLGAFTALAMGAIPVGTVLGGLVLETFGLRSTLIGVAICYSLVIVSVIVNPVLKRIDDEMDPVESVTDNKSECLSKP